MNTENIKKYKYTFDEYDVTIPGYFKIQDLNTFTMFSSIQSEHNLIENAVEIGVYYGRGVVHLSNLDYKHVLGIDLFENQIENISQSGKCDENTYDEVLKYLNQYGISEKVELIKCNSMTINRDKLQNVSFFHIDGGHSYSESYSDLLICSNNAIDQSIISMDDMFNADWPDVSAATSQFLINNKKFRAILFSGNKIYLCKDDVYSFYHDAIIKYCDKNNIHIFDGHQIKFLNSNIIKI